MSRMWQYESQCFSTVDVLLVVKMGPQ